MNRPDAKTLLASGEAAALAAGQMLRVGGQPDLRHVEQAAGHDVKLKADRAAEALIFDLLSRLTGLGVYSEESGNLRQAASGEPCWIVDPLDGSLNYLQGIPFSAVSLALYQDREPLLGVVYDWQRQELFSGVVGEGAWLNGQPLSPSSVVDRKQGVLGTGFPVRSDFSSEGLGRFIGEIQGFRKVRLLGSAALSLAYVAAGRLEAYREENIMFWDVAAGWALARAVGCQSEASWDGGYGSRLPLRVWAPRMLW
ncbi:MAG: inositol monophosphatase [Magnetococcales bacterium]|nr:inositol monophosphatase [Magnetococcales bacterium]